MIIELTKVQARVVLELLTKYAGCGDMNHGEVSSSVNETRLEWDESKVEIEIPD